MSPDALTPEHLTELLAAFGIAPIGHRDTRTVIVLTIEQGQLDVLCDRFEGERCMQRFTTTKRITRLAVVP